MERYLSKWDVWLRVRSLDPPKELRREGERRGVRVRNGSGHRDRGFILSVCRRKEVVVRIVKSDFASVEGRPNKISGSLTRGTKMNKEGFRKKYLVVHARKSFYLV